MAYSESLRGRLLDYFDSRPHIVEKRMFGGYAYLLQGNMVAGVMKNAMLFRIGHEEEEQAILLPEVRPFMNAGRKMSGWIIIDEEHLEEEPVLRGWLEKAIEFVKGMPGK